MCLIEELGISTLANPLETSQKETIIIEKENIKRWTRHRDIFSNAIQEVIIM